MLLLLKRLPLLLLLLCSTTRIASQPSAKDTLQAGTYTLAPDSSNFVTASLVIAEPRGALLSVFGHASLRMECPVHHLDFVFTLESDPSANAFTKGISGKADSRFVAVPTEVFLNDCREQQRGVCQYNLTLTHHEKQELWRLLDENMAKESHGRFHLQKNNCLTSTILNVKQCLIGEYFEWGPKEYPSTLNDGDFLRYSLRQSPWSEFIAMTFAGTAYRGHSREEERMTPKTIVDMLRKARFVNTADGTSRPVISDEGTLLVKGRKEMPTPFTPAIVFGALLLLTCLETLAEWKLRWQRLARWFDITLFALQTIIAILLMGTIVYSEVFTSRWNWYIVEFAPVPLLLWLTVRGKGIEPTCWLTYSAVLALFILMTPLLGELDLPHQLITAALLVRSLNRYLVKRNKNKKLS